MRANEFLFENYNQQLESDLTNLLVAAKANGARNVKTQAIVQQLQGMGYSVDTNSIITLLQGNPVVTNATPQSIILTAPEGAEGGNAGQDSAARVSDMAAKATTIG